MPTQKAMKNNLYPVHWLKIIFDIFTVVLLFSIFQILKIFAKPFKSGFYCNDYSVSMPFRSSTVTNLSLIVSCVLMPFAFLALTELARSVYAKRRSSSKKFVYKIRLFQNHMVNVSERCGNLYINFGSFFFGLASTVIITDFAKVVVGRLRPNFLDVCKPDVNPYRSLCANRTYLVPDVDFKCTSRDTPNIDESRLSFPSGHASISFYSMLFLVLFVNQTWKFTRFGLLPRFVQFLLFSVALFISLSRISDNKHHPTDVLAGAALGAIISSLTFCYLTDLLKKNNYHVKCTSSDCREYDDDDNDDDGFENEYEQEDVESISNLSSSKNGRQEHVNILFEKLTSDDNNNFIIRDDGRDRNKVTYPSREVRFPV